MKQMVHKVPLSFFFTVRKIFFWILCAFFLLIIFLIGFYFLFPGVLLNYVIAYECYRANLSLKSAAIDDGWISYYEGGSGEPLVLLHGFGSGKNNFIGLAGGLTGRYRVIVPDLIGFGESSRIGGLNYKPTAQAVRVEQFVKKIGLKQKVHVGGSSMGGQIALAWAIMYPDRVKSLWLMSPAGLWNAPKSELMLNYEKTGRMTLLVEKEEDFFVLREMVMSDPPYIPSAFLMEIARDGVLHKDLSRNILMQIREESVDSWLDKVAVPTLLVWGDEDKVLSPHSLQLFSNKIHKSTSILMRGVGHLPFLENNSQTIADYLKFRDNMPASKAENF